MKYPNIIGREAEIAILERLYKSKKSEFVAIYGRRRIGKSYLVNEVYGSKIKIYSEGEWVNCGAINLTGSNKTFIANTRMTKANY